ncbi:MAG: DNA (cytosine-5-)-methyltransferase, partial [Candidatus Moranbacteria bacterium]|nr:DNA (cytosine-5-)-methyltransferase [Candidatus Moranbacteria bacterium]
MKILSLFDGISCARVALERAGIKVDKYYASEIDKYAIQIAQKNYLDTIQIGDITKIETIKKFTPKGKNNYEKEEIDLIIGGSPCQDLSIAKKNRQGLKGGRSGLFYEFVRLVKEIKPKYFILENVNSMPKEAKETITKELWGIEPVMINAALVSAQNRKRLFWVGELTKNKYWMHSNNFKETLYEKVEIPQPKDKGILLKDILETGKVDRDKSYCIDANYFKGGSLKNYLDKKRRQVVLKQSESRLMVKDTIRIGQIGKGDR